MKIKILFFLITAFLFSSAFTLNKLKLKKGDKVIRTEVFFSFIISNEKSITDNEWDYFFENKIKPEFDDYIRTISNVDKDSKFSNSKKYSDKGKIIVLFHKKNDEIKDKLIYLKNVYKKQFKIDMVKWKSKKVYVSF